MSNSFAEDEITQEDCWIVISSFFDDKGLVRQQLDSFDEFMKNTIQEIVDEQEELVLEAPSQHTGGPDDVNVHLMILTKKRNGTLSSLGKSTSLGRPSRNPMAPSQTSFLRKRACAISRTSHLLQKKIFRAPLRRHEKGNERSRSKRSQERRC